MILFTFIRDFLPKALLDAGLIVIRAPGETDGCMQFGDYDMAITTDSDIPTYCHVLRIVRVKQDKQWVRVMRLFMREEVLNELQRQSNGHLQTQQHLRWFSDLAGSISKHLRFTFFHLFHSTGNDHDKVVPGSSAKWALRAFHACGDNPPLQAVCFSFIFSLSKIKNSTFLCGQSACQGGADTDE